MSQLWLNKFRGTLAAALVMVSLAFASAPTRAADCNENGVDDLMDVDPSDPDGNGEVSADCNANGVPDECEIGPFEVKFTSASAGGPDRFGYSADIRGNVAIVGRYTDTSASQDPGSADVFRRVNGEWQMEARLTASDAAADDLFGYAVAIDGDRAVVGAFGNDIAGYNSGSAYVFERIDEQWQQRARLTPFDGAELDVFGHAVAISGDTVMIGAHQDDDFGARSGSVYVYRRVNTAWQYQMKLNASDANAVDEFGREVSLDGDYAVIGAELNDDGAGNAGSAYIFRRVGNNWQQSAKLLPSDPSQSGYFGECVDIRGNTAIVGAYRNNNAGVMTGVAYIYRNNTGAWQQEARLTASDGLAEDAFGLSVAIDGDSAVVGASGRDDEGDHSGAAYVFRRINNQWVETRKLNASDAAENDRFGRGVAIDGEIVVVGAYLDDDSGDESGSAYFYDLRRQDCNLNDVPDDCDLDPSDPDGNGTVVPDCNGNDIPDSCDVDCNQNGIPDDCDTDPTDPDGDGIVVDDCNGNGLPDSCEPECNTNGVPDDCDIDPSDPDGDGIVIADCNGNLIPDDCEDDCNGNGVPDDCDIDPADPDGDGVVIPDCDGNHTPDDCDVDCNNNGIPDRCDINTSDPDGDGVVYADCNFNGRPDDCDVDSTDPDGDGTVADDCNANGIPDICETSLGADIVLPDPMGYIFIGGCVAIDGDQIVVTNGIDGVEAEIPLFAATFRRIDGAWQYEATMTGTDVPEIAFSNTISCSVSGDAIITGWQWQSPFGEAYVFRKVNGNWQEETKLVAADATGNGRFGAAVAIDGDLALVGDYYGSHVGVNNGAVYVFRRTDGLWQEQQKLIASDALSNDSFGGHISLDEDTLLVAATGARTGGIQSGAVYVFELIDGSWQQVAKLGPSDPESFDAFGGGVAIQGDTAIVGAPSSDDDGSRSGSAYVFRKIGGVWQQTQKLTASDAAASRYFGQSVAIENDLAIVASRSGTYLFRRDNGSWVETKKITARTTESVAVDNGTVIVGHPEYEAPNGGGGFAQVFDLRSRDCNLNDIPDDCELPGDMDGDGVADLSDFDEFVTLLLSGTNCPLGDFNQDGAFNSLDIAGFIDSVFSADDCNHNGIADSSDILGDVNGDGNVDIDDIPGFVSFLLNASDCSLADINQDGSIDGDDVAGLSALLIGP